MSGRPSHKAEMVKPQPVKPDTAQPPQCECATVICTGGIV